MNRNDNENEPIRSVTIPNKSINENGNEPFFKLFDKIKKFFFETVGVDVTKPYDFSNCEHYFTQHSLDESQFKAVIRHEWNDERQRDYFKKYPNSLSLGSIFNPKRETIVLNILEGLKIRKLIKSAPLVPQTDHAEVQILKLRLGCCGGIFDKKMVKIYPDGCPKGKWIWLKENQELYENHATLCLTYHPKEIAQENSLSQLPSY